MILPCISDLMTKGTRAQEAKRMEESMKFLRETSEKQAASLTQLTQLEKTMEAIIREARSTSRQPTNATRQGNFDGPLTDKNRGQIPPIKRISVAEMQEMREKKLCYYCDEKNEPRHKCKKKHIYVLEWEELEANYEEEEDAENDEELIIYVHALAGATSHQMMRFRNVSTTSLVHAREGVYCRYEVVGLRMM
ncbi:hypothetical protein EZV62_021969 [Acer yangbiense]|uniref:Uncharacterized protein n=1 Tax=Acer yangbiense TaxID=1000413 RepID=A0A5C7H746_9ROSI|nr:hypothetical protein EZV62_021969 [Acer yangbiense]